MDQVIAPQLRHSCCQVQHTQQGQEMYIHHKWPNSALKSPYTAYQSQIGLPPSTLTSKNRGSIHPSIHLSIGLSIYKQMYRVTLPAMETLVFHPFGHSAARHQQGPIAQAWSSGCHQQTPNISQLYDMFKCGKNTIVVHICVYYTHIYIYHIVVYIYICK